MPQTQKIATCCYCGTRAILVLDQSRHELACSACGAPLHEMKLMPKPAPRVNEFAPSRNAPRTTKRSNWSYPQERPYFKARKKPKRRKGKYLSKKLFEEFWDVVEDIFD